MREEKTVHFFDLLKQQKRTVKKVIENANMCLDLVGKSGEKGKRGGVFLQKDGEEPIAKLQKSTAEWLLPLIKDNLVSAKAKLIPPVSQDSGLPFLLDVQLELADIEALKKAATVSGEQDPIFGDVYAAWRDRKEYSVDTLKHFCETINNSGKKRSPVSALFLRLLEHHCVSAPKKPRRESEERRSEPRRAISEEEKTERLEEMKEAIMRHLSREGFRPVQEEENPETVHFKYEGGNYFVCCDRDDPQFVRIVYPNFWAIEGKRELRNAMEAANHATWMTKCAKVFVFNREQDRSEPPRMDTWATIELFVPGPEAFNRVFIRNLYALKNAVMDFIKTMNELDKGLANNE